MPISERAAHVVFGSSRRWFFAVLLVVAVVRCGVWYDPNSDVVRSIAIDPFTNPFGDSALDHLMFNWLAPFLAWAVRATGHWQFIGFQLLFAVAGSLLFYYAAFRRMSDRSARVACVLFFLLPVSTHGYYWSGGDSVTIFLLIVAFAFSDRLPVLVMAGIALGMQDFELGVIAAAAAAIAIAASPSARHRLDFGVGSALTFVGAVAVGRGVLEIVFRVSDIDVHRGNSVRALFPTLLDTDMIRNFAEQVAKSPFLVAYSALGLGWIVLVVYVRRGVEVGALLVPLAALFLVVFLTDDQTRVFGIVSLPLLMVFWMFNEGFLSTFDDRFVVVLLVVWLIVPWMWVIAGRPQVSATPYSVALVVGKTTGWFEPSDDPAWPFLYDPSTASPLVPTAEATAHSPAGPSASDSAPGRVSTGGSEVAAIPAPLDVDSAAAAESGGIRFLHQVVDGDPPTGDECCLDVITPGDVDGDGAVDLVIGTEHADGLSWYRNPGSGNVASGWERWAIGAGDFTTDGEATDLDGDGDVDVVASSIDRNLIEWWEQVADPTTTAGWSRHEIGGEFAHDLVVADVDGDGDLDVGAFQNAASSVEWFEQPDDPTAEWTSHLVADIDGEGLTAADLDSDGDIDLVAGPAVYSNDDGTGLAWTRTVLDDAWEPRARSAVGDLDDDGAVDIVLSSPETDGRLAWFRGPHWTEQIVDDDAGYTHSLEVGDLDLDGDLDLMVGVMHWAGSREVGVLLGDGGDTWTRVVLATTGTHNAVLVDLDSDGRLDIAGKNFEGPKQVEVWWNKPFEAVGPPELPTADPSAVDPLDNYSYVEVDATRSRFNDATAYFGLDFGDLDGDGDDDIAAGGYLYLNPGVGLDRPWDRIELEQELGTVVDAMLITDVDGDAHADVIAEALPDVWWLEAADGGMTWSGRVVAQVPATTRPNGQGYRTGDIDGDGRPEIVLSGGNEENEIWYLTVSADPDAGAWEAVRVTSQATDEQMGIGDIDGDGDNDVVAGGRSDGGLQISWFENPANGASDWELHKIGDFSGVFPDRLGVADVDGDGRLDVVVSEENQSEAPDAEVMWYRQPEQRDVGDWKRLVISTQYSTNGMDLADMDGDGDVDVVTGELFGDKRVTVWASSVSNGEVEWSPHHVDEGKESHLGARVWDLDGDGDLEVVSIGWNEPQYLHLWVNR